jgi:hypothetical protein
MIYKEVKGLLSHLLGLYMATIRGEKGLEQNRERAMASCGHRLELSAVSSSTQVVHRGGIGPGIGPWCLGFRV